LKAVRQGDAIDARPETVRERSRHGERVVRVVGDEETIDTIQRLDREKQPNDGRSDRDGCGDPPVNPRRWWKARAWNTPIFGRFDDKDYARDSRGQVGESRERQLATLR